ncbi:MAG: aldehyde dehydrogenase family protein [Desulfobacter sp.]|nr:aldehyde dehydrogenase family protein [Desulfobacter sp.]WDP83869.1 MAG: aldehyde dehydrogenase family protein [Desulfobacter sp.]
MTAAIAAGNRVMVKQAANSQNLCRLLARKFSEKISMEKIAILPGTPGKEFSCLAYDHLIFTGSPQVGKTIMEGASTHLTPVTLELGGKSPTILAEDFDIKTAVERIMYGKLINSGQTCIAPDYLFVPQDKIDAFIETAKKVVSKRYPTMKTRDYTNIIDRRAYGRLVDTLEDARAKNADIINLLPGPQTDEPLKKISPTIVRSVTQDMRIMKEEIFGPLLPVMGYTSMDQVIEYINARPRPLALTPPYGAGIRRIYTAVKKFKWLS